MLNERELVTKMRIAIENKLNAIEKKHNRAVGVAFSELKKNVQGPFNKPEMSSLLPIGRVSGNLARNTTVRRSGLTALFEVNVPYFKYLREGTRRKEGFGSELANRIAKAYLADMRAK